VTRSGENELHGDAWEFVRNDIFNANAFSGTRPAAEATLKQNQFGARLAALSKEIDCFTSVPTRNSPVNGSIIRLLIHDILPPLTNDRSAPRSVLSSVQRIRPCCAIQVLTLPEEFRYLAMAPHNPVALKLLH